MLIMSLNESKLIFLHTMKWFQVLLHITNNSLKYQLFIYTQLTDQTVIFLTIQLSISHLFAHSLNVKQFYLTHRTLSGATPPVQSGSGRNSNEEVFRIPQNSSLTIRLFSVVSRTLVGKVLSLQRDAVSVFFSPS